MSVHQRRDEVDFETVQNLGGLTLTCGTKDGPVARPRRGLGQGWPAPIRRTPRFWTVSCYRSARPLSRAFHAEAAPPLLAGGDAMVGDEPGHFGTQVHWTRMNRRSAAQPA